MPKTVLRVKSVELREALRVGARSRAVFSLPRDASGGVDIVLTPFGIEWDRKLLPWPLIGPIHYADDVEA